MNKNVYVNNNIFLHCPKCKTAFYPLKGFFEDRQNCIWCGSKYLVFDSREDYKNYLRNLKLKRLT